MTYRKTPDGTRTVDLIANAVGTLSLLPGWGTDFTQELECHPETPALTFRDTSSEISLTLCPRCLRAYLCVGLGLVATSSNIAEDRECNRCGKTYPMANFVGNAGYPTRFCAECRAQWAKDKRKAEAKAEAEAAALEEADVKKTLAAMRKDLRRIEASLGESE